LRHRQRCCSATHDEQACNGRGAPNSRRLQRGSNFRPAQLSHETNSVRFRGFCGSARGGARGVRSRALTLHHDGAAADAQSELPPSCRHRRSANFKSAELNHPAASFERVGKRVDYSRHYHSNNRVGRIASNGYVAIACRADFAGSNDRSVWAKGFLDALGRKASCSHASSGKVFRITRHCPASIGAKLDAFYQVAASFVRQW
jgi:hypothetical protein